MREAFVEVALRDSVLRLEQQFRRLLPDLRRSFAVPWTLYPFWHIVGYQPTVGELIEKIFDF